MAALRSLQRVNLNKGTFLKCRCVMLNSQKAYSYQESDRKSGYRKIKRRTAQEVIDDGVTGFQSEMGKLAGEARDLFKTDYYHEIFGSLHGDYERFYTFNNSDDIKGWTVTTDKDHNEGISVGELVLGPKKTGLFRGTINPDAPNDGELKYSGYANMTLSNNTKAFFRRQSLDWSHYNNLVIRYRGDGRAYLINLAMDRIFDVNWNDQYNYPLFTRGGPYWQIAKIPFSKFILSSKGRVQDHQERINTHMISTIGLSMADGNAGPFQLELDFIGGYYDENHHVEFDYEMYKVKAYEVY